MERTGLLTAHAINFVTPKSSHPLKRGCKYASLIPALPLNDFIDRMFHLAVEGSIVYQSLVQEKC